MKKLTHADVVVDLSLPEERRWDGLETRDVRAAQALAHEAWEAIPSTYRRVTALGARVAYAAAQGPYQGEIRGLAYRAGLSIGVVCALQLLYEMSHTYSWAQGMVFGCTASVTEEGGVLVHRRTLDWPLDLISKATRRVRFRGGDREFEAVTPLGSVGVLTGMVPGAYSVSINYAPPQHVPVVAASPALLLRHVLETCDTYEEAVEALSATRLSTSVFYTVCGTTAACVIERTSNSYWVRHWKGGALVQANHYASRTNQGLNEPLRAVGEDGGPTVMAFSQARMTAMQARPSRAMGAYPVLNSTTRQVITLTPCTGGSTVLV